MLLLFLVFFVPNTWAMSKTKNILAVGTKGKIQIINADTGKVIKTFTTYTYKYGQDYRFHTDFGEWNCPSVYLAWNHQGIRLAVGGRGVNILDVRNWGKKERLDAPPYLYGKKVYSVAWNQDGKHLAIAAGGHTRIFTCDAARCTETHFINGSMDKVAWGSGPASKYLAFRSKENIKILDITKKDRVIKADDLKTLGGGHDEYISSIVWRPDSNELASATCNGTIKLWNIQTLKEERSFRGKGIIIAWSPNGRYLAAGVSMVEIWDMKNLEKPYKVLHPKKSNSRFGCYNAIASISWNWDGTRLATGSLAGMVNVWDTGSWESQAFDIGKRSISSLEFRPVADARKEELAQEDLQERIRYLRDELDKLEEKKKELERSLGIKLGGKMLDVPKVFVPEVAKDPKALQKSIKLKEQIIMQKKEIERLQAKLRKYKSKKEA